MIPKELLYMNQNDMKIMEKYNNLHQMIDKKILTPDDVVNMDLTKAYVQTELINLGKEFDDSYRIYIFLIHIVKFTT